MATSAELPAAVPLLGRRRDLAAFRGDPRWLCCQEPGWSLASNLAFLPRLLDGPVAWASPHPDLGKDSEARSFLAWEAGWRALNGLEPEAPAGWAAWARRGDPLLKAALRDPLGFHEENRLRARAGDDRMPGLAPTLARMAWIAQMVDRDLLEEGLDLARRGAPYRASLGYALAWSAGLDAVARAARPDLPVVFAPKVEAEFEAALDLYPEVLLLPTFGPCSRAGLVRLRRVPVHPLGLHPAPVFLDGAWRSPREAFLHDLDHARYKVREDLALQGLGLPDPYRSRPGILRPDTLEDAARGRHRAVLHHADPREVAGLAPRTRSESRGGLATACPRDLRAALGLLRFELHHEKSLPLDPDIWARETAAPVHLEKLRLKLATGFFGDLPCGPEALEAAAVYLSRLARERAS